MKYIRIVPSKLLSILLLFFVLLSGACIRIEPSRPTDIYFVAESWFNVDEYVTEFQESYPNVRVHVSYQAQVADDWPKYFDAALLQNKPYDTDLFLDLKPLIEKDRRFDADDYHPGTLATGYESNLERSDDRVVAIPLSLEFDVLAYAPQEISRSGAENPKPGWTWTDLMDLAVAVGNHRLDQNHDSVLVREGGQWTLLLNWLHEQAPVFENKEGHLVPLFDRPTVEMALPRACERSSPLRTYIDPESGLSLDVLDYLQSGVAVMGPYPLGSFLSRRAQYPGLKVEAFPQPNIYEDVRAFGVLSMSRGTQHTEVVWKWIGALSKASSLAKYADLPARQSAAAELGSWDAMDGETARIVRTILDGQKTWTWQDRGLVNKLRIYLGKMVAQICGLGMDPGEVIVQTQEGAAAATKLWREHDTPLEPFVVEPILDLGEGLSVLTVSATNTDGRIYQAVAPKFEAANPGWSIQVSGPSPERRTADIEAAILGNYNPLWFSYVQQNWLPLDSMILADLQLSTDQFTPQALDSVSWQGQIVGVPVAVRPLVLYYSAEEFNKLGISPPSSEWTVTDVLHAAEQIISMRPGWVSYAPSSGDEVRFVLEQQGISLFADEGHPVPRFADPEVVQAINRLRTLQGSGSLLSIKPAIMQLPMYIFGKPTYQGKAMDVMALTPRPAARWPTLVHVCGVPREGKNTNADMAWKLISFLPQNVYLEQELPAIQSPADSETRTSTLGESLYAAYTTALERSAALPGKSDDTMIQDAASWWFEQALRETEEEALQDALQRAQGQAEQFVDCMGGLSVNASTLSQCAKQVDTEHPLARIAR